MQTRVNARDESPLGRLLREAQRRAPIRTAVVDPWDALSLGGAVAAREQGLITPVLVGAADRIERTAGSAHWMLSGMEIVGCAPGDEPFVAARLAAVGAVHAIMKGAVHSDVLLHAVLAEQALRNRDRLSHVVVTEMPGRPTPLLLTDGAVNIAPDLDVKRQIVQNAIDVAQALGLSYPRVAILAAVETVVSAMDATLDAAALTEMSRRGQIAGGIVDGPLALDDAISESAAHAKELQSAVAGHADILVSPDLETGNMLYKAFDVLLRARFGAIVYGANVPIIFTSRADSIESRVFSCALARLAAHARTGTGAA